MLRVGIDPTWAPIEFFDEQRRPQGISVAYLRLIAERLRLRLEFVEAPSWAAAFAQFDRRQLDLLPAVAATPLRRQRFDLTEPYVSFPAAIFAAADVAYLGGIEALQGKVVAVIESEAAHDWLREQEPDIPLLPVADTTAALRAVARGEAFAFVGNLAATSYYIGASGLTEIKVFGETPFVYRLGMAVHRDEPLLAAILQKGLDAIPRHERDAIYHDWISIRYQVEAGWGLLSGVVAGAALLLAIIGWWAFSLAREVRRRRRVEIPEIPGTDHGFWKYQGQSTVSGEIPGTGHGFWVISADRADRRRLASSFRVWPEASGQVRRTTVFVICF